MTFRLASLVVAGLLSTGATDRAPAVATAFTQQPGSQIAVIASDGPYFAGEPIVFRARLEPSGQPALLYRWFVDGQPAGNSWQDSAEFTYLPRAPGPHVVHAEAGRRAPGGRRAAGLAIRPLEVPGRRLPFEVQPRPALSVAVSERAVRLGVQVTFTASISPAISEAQFFRFHVGGRPTGGWQASPSATFVADRPGRHLVHVEVGARRRGGSELSRTVIAPLVSSAPTPFEIRSAAPPSSVALTLALLSSDLQPGAPARFAVTATGASGQPRYLFDPGDGTGEHVRDDHEFSFVYQRPGSFVASVRAAPGLSLTGASVTVPVAEPAPVPVRLTLVLTSPAVVQGEPASFTVAADGPAGVPEYLLDPGDGSAARTQSGGTFTFTYTRAGTYRAAVSLPPGVLGTGAAATVVVAPARRARLWLAGLAGLIGLLIAGRVLARRATEARPDLKRGAPPTVIAVADRTPRFEPGPSGMPFEIRQVRNVDSLRALFDELDPRSSRIESADRQALGTALRHAAAGLEWTPTPSTFGPKLLELLDVPLPDLFVAFWSTADAIAAAIETSRHSPDAVIDVPLEDCWTEATLAPYIEVRVNGPVPPKRIAFSVRLPLAFKSAGLQIQGGAIRRATGGVCEIGGSLALGDLTIARLKEPVLLALADCTFDRADEDATR